MEQVGDLPVMRDGSPQPRLTDIASLKPGTMPGLIERYNGQHVVSLTANIHGLTLGEAARRIERAVAAAGAPPRGVTVRMRGEIPPLGADAFRPAHGLAAGSAGDLLLLAANFQSVRLALAIVLTVPAVLCGVLGCSSRPELRSTCNRSWARLWRSGSRWPTRSCW